MFIRLLATLLAAMLVSFGQLGEATGGGVQETQQETPGDALPDLLPGAWTEAAAAPAQTLVLREDGTAEVHGQPATWRRFGRTKLRIQRGGKVERPKFTLTGSSLTVHWEDGTKAYTRSKPGFPEVPPALDAGQAAPGTGTQWKHPRDYFTCILPRRWKVEAIDDWVMVIDPGLTGKDTLEAIVFVGWGELDAAARGKTPVQLMQQREAEWLRQLRADGLRLAKAKMPPQRVLVGDVPGAEQEWSGKAQNGELIRLWAGSIVKRDAFLYVAVLAVAGKEAEYFPKAKHLFLSVIPTPPERNRALETRLAGRSVVSSNNSSSGGTGWKYSFRADGTVESFWYLTGAVGLDVASTSQTEWATYEVFGDALYIYFKSGQVEARVETDAAGNPGALFMKGARYPL